ncbi:methyl-viologen-reducing hydrogenase subunit delta [bacterium]|nr:MAG: methyl-viologen-reducing hydrogenase subunit delta [bacterium]
MNRFEPKIVAFLCNFCSYEGADRAGSSKLEVPPNIRSIRVMCSGRVEPEMVIEALTNGADGVLILGCHPGDCHFKEGNYKTLRRHSLLLRMLREFGIEPKRVRLDWVSASEGQKFAEVTNEMTEIVRSLGPLELTACR